MVWQNVDIDVAGAAAAEAVAAAAAFMRCCGAIVELGFLGVGDEPELSLSDAGCWRLAWFVNDGFRKKLQQKKKEKNIDPLELVRDHSNS